jgi:putative endonuclease
LPDFTERYSVRRLVWYDSSPNVAAVVAREREIKGWSRAKKVRLIEATNGGWEDLAMDWFQL